MVCHFKATLYVSVYLSSCVEINPDPRSCTPGTPGICDTKATCTPVTPYVCSATRARSYKCECNQGYTGDGIDCAGELILAVTTGINDANIIHFISSVGMGINYSYSDFL